ncbi:hypothetical protein ACQKWADRAFT_312474 [Trichoderma austrokoningii]
MSVSFAAEGLNGSELFTNNSESHHSSRKLNERIALIQEAARENGSIYLYANQSGAQFSLLDVEVVIATVDLEEVRTYRFAPSRNFQAVQAPVYERIEVDFTLSQDNLRILEVPTPTMLPKYHVPEEEIALGPATTEQNCRLSSSSSGGIDSCATAAIAYSMRRLAVQAVRLATFSNILANTPEEFCNQIFHAVFMEMAAQSSKETRQRAKDLASRIGSHHTDMNVDDTFHATKNLLTQGTGFEPITRALWGPRTIDSIFALSSTLPRSRAGRLRKSTKG